jgi:formylglycine-generating enzyme required for sulfatase activity
VFDMTQTEDGQLILVMEYMPGGDLASLIENEGRLNVPDVIRYAQQIAEGLKAAHAAGFVHRDVKPQNVLLGADSKVAKLADFGVVTDRDGARTTSMMRTGSEGFAAPEQWQLGGKHLDGRTDIYALGATMYLMLAGRMPYGDLALRDWVSAIHAGPPPSLRTILPSISEELDGLVLAMLAVDRERRPRDASEVLARLDDCSSPKVPLPPKRVETIVETPRPAAARELYTPTVKVEVSPVQKIEARPEITQQPKRWPLVAACVLLVIVITGLFAYRAYNRTENAAPIADTAKVAPPKTGKEGPKPAPSAERQLPGPEVFRKTTKVNDKDGLIYVWIPPGTFQMGCSPGDSECAHQEKPAHEVTITTGFWMGQTPVTQEAYKKVTGNAPSHFKGDKLPVETVSWKDAQTYCEKAGMRLPTEAEWEYAARAGTTGSRYGDLDQIAWYTKNSGKTTHAVGQKQANALGLYDMLGNVSESVADWYADKYLAHTQRDPAGPAGGQFRLVRGFSWANGDRDARVSRRGGDLPETAESWVGFRCAGIDLPFSPRAQH